MLLIVSFLTERVFERGSIRDGKGGVLNPSFTLCEFWKSHSSRIFSKIIKLRKCSAIVHPISFRTFRSIINDLRTLRKLWGVAKAVFDLKLRLMETQVNTKFYFLVVKIFLTSCYRKFFRHLRRICPIIIRNAAL